MDAFELDSKEHDRDSDIKASLERLNHSVEALITLFRTASADIHSEQDGELSRKLDILIQQNEEIARALLTLLDIHKEHLPKISKQAEDAAADRQASPRRRSPMPPMAPAQKIEPKLSPVPAPSQPVGAAPQQAMQPDFMSTPRLPDNMLFDLPNIPDSPSDQKPAKKGLFGLPFGK